MVHEHFLYVCVHIGTDGNKYSYCRKLMFNQNVFNEYRYLSDDEDEEDYAAEDGTLPENEVVGTVAPARQSARQQQQQQQQQSKKADSSGRKNSLRDRGTVGSPFLSRSQEYFVLPLTRGNVACH